MKKWMLFALVALLGWQYMENPAWQSRFSRPAEAPQPSAEEVLPPAQSTAPPSPAPALAFNCDGRKRCSQMTSCEEAKNFLQHCPGMEMDGDHDGVPCEGQWCR